MHIGLILRGARVILINWLLIRFNAKCKLRDLPSVVQGVIFGLARVFKVKVAEQCVGSRSWGMLVCCHLFFAFSSSEADSFLTMMLLSWPLWIVLGWADGCQIVASFALIFFLLD